MLPKRVWKQKNETNEDARNLIHHAISTSEINRIRQIISNTYFIEHDVTTYNILQI
jgi:hypothetical protein